MKPITSSDLKQFEYLWKSRKACIKNPYVIAEVEQRILRWKRYFKKKARPSKSPKKTTGKRSPFLLKGKVLKKTPDKLTPFRRRVLDSLRFYENTPRSRWIADDLQSNENRVSEALQWLENHLYIDRTDLTDKDPSDEA